MSSDLSFIFPETHGAHLCRPRTDQILTVKNCTLLVLANTGRRYMMLGWTKAANASLGSWQQFWQAWTCRRLTICSEGRRVLAYHTTGRYEYGFILAQQRRKNLTHSRSNATAAALRTEVPSECVELEILLDVYRSSRDIARHPVRPR